MLSNQVEGLAGAALHHSKGDATGSERRESSSSSRTLAEEWLTLPSLLAPLPLDHHLIILPSAAVSLLTLVILVAAAGNLDATHTTGAKPLPDLEHHPTGALMS